MAKFLLISMIVLSAFQAKASVVDKFTACLSQELKNKPDLEPALAYDAKQVKIEAIELSPQQEEIFKKFIEVGELQERNYAQFRRCQDKTDNEFEKKKSNIEKTWSYQSELGEFAKDKKSIKLDYINSALYQAMTDEFASSIQGINEIYVTSEQEKKLKDLNECYSVESPQDCAKSAKKILVPLQPSFVYASIIRSRLEVFLTKQHAKIRGKNCQKEIADQDKLKIQIQRQKDILKEIFLNLGYALADIEGFSLKDIKEIMKGKKTIIKVSYASNTEKRAEIKNEIAELNKVVIADRDFNFYKKQTKLFGLIKALEAESIMYLYDKAGLVTRAKIGISVRDEDTVRCNNSSSKSFLYNSSSGSR